jgi:DDE superfamily endonuclease
MAIEAIYPAMRLIHIFLDNARYHHAKLVQAWLAQPGGRIKLHFIPAHCPHLDPIERLWGLMHRHTTHNKCYNSVKDFSITMLSFLRDDVPRNWHIYCGEVTDNFRIIDPKKIPDYRVSRVYTLLLYRARALVNVKFHSVKLEAATELWISLSTGC